MTFEVAGARHYEAGGFMSNGQSSGVQIHVHLCVSSLVYRSLRRGIALRRMRVLYKMVNTVLVMVVTRLATNALLSLQVSSAGQVSYLL